jgi:dihydropteroate synthase
MTTKIMGILNITPNSFSDGGLYLDPDTAYRHAEHMLEEGADMIDIGGESSRPGSLPVSPQEELDRILPVLERVLRLDTSVSVDTSKSVVANEALRLGACMINDISGLRFDPQIAHYVARYDAGLVIMHMKGVPQTMQENPEYTDLVQEICDFLKKQAKIALDAGVKHDRIILDPGIGFGKRLEDNAVILKNLDTFRNLKYPIMIGASRKSMIGDITQAGVHDRLPGSLAIACVAAIRGADFIRVHDVAETVQALRVLDYIW